MVQYTGKTCLICKQIFDDNDDIVVCPECGTPYHRDCYRKEGCQNTELHRTGGSWQDTAEPSEGAEKCPNCGTELREGAQFCDRCGSPVGTAGRIPSYRGRFGQNMQGGMQGAMGFTEFSEDGRTVLTAGPADVLEEDVTVDEMSRFVGSNKQYYLPRFVLMNRLNMKISFNLAAFFFPEAYLAYRKMYLPAILVFVLRTIILLPWTAQLLGTMLADQTYYSMLAQVLADQPEMLRRLAVFAALGSGENTSNAASAIGGLSAVSSFLNVALEMGMCLFANSLYYRHCILCVKKIKEDNMAGNIEMLGGTSVIGLVVFLLLMFARLYVSMFFLLNIV